MKRLPALILIVLLIAGLLPLQTGAREPSGMLTPENLSGEKFSRWPELTFWRQETFTRGEVESVTFRNDLYGLPGDAWDLSAAEDRSILGWFRSGTLYIAAQNTIVLNENSAYLFAGMNHCREIRFNGVVDTSRVKQMNGMFMGCAQLEKVDLADFDTTSAATMASMFYGCANLEELDLSGFETENVTSMNRMFTACTGLKELDLSGFRTPVLTDMTAMFDSCRNLETAVLSRFDTSRVTSMANLFGTCPSLKQADVSSFRTGSVTNLNNMFYGCKALTELDLSGFTTRRGVTTTNMFKKAKSLADIHCDDPLILKAYARR